jgi:hypothetical protein
MEIFQPTITGSLSAAGLVYFTGLTSASYNSVLTYDSASGEIFFTSSIGGGGSGAGFPYSGSAVITGSLLVSGSGLTVEGGITGSLYGTASWAINAFTASHATNFTIDTTLTLDQTITDYASVTSTIVGTNNLFTRATGSYTAAFGKYTLYSGVNSRAGEFVTSWNDGTITYYDNSTTDNGSTSDISFTSTVVAGNIQIRAVALSSGWTVKMLATFI